jgi:hypothetical protein
VPVLPRIGIHVLPGTALSGRIHAPDGLACGADLGGPDGARPWQGADKSGRFRDDLSASGHMPAVTLVPARAGFFWYSPCMFRRDMKGTGAARITFQERCGI